MRVFNFSAGPSALPLAVLERARDELIDFAGSGMSIMEMSHRGDLFVAIAEAAEQRLRRLLHIPDHYKVLFLQGGATAQFSAIPLNLPRKFGRAAYVNTGIWSTKALTEAQRFIPEVVTAATTAATSFRRIPAADEWVDVGDVDYLHYTDNETIGGVEFPDVPDVSGTPLVCDMSSNILSRPFDIERFGLVYAGAQKNMGPSGITVVIVREDLIGKAQPLVPSVLDYAIQAQSGSMLNTPPTYAWYLLGLVLEWLEGQGGVLAMATENARKASLLYDCIDQSFLFANPIEHGSRSRMNIPFTLHREELESDFLQGARHAGLVNLEGHRSVGGFRASLYNAMPYAGVERLVEYLREFEHRYG